MSPNFFANQLSVIGENYQFISQDDLVKHLGNGVFPEGNFCLITFDDGLKEQVNAFKWLQSMKIPAVFYIPVMPLVESRVLDVHKLHFIRANRSDMFLLDFLKNNIDYSFSELDFALAKDQYKYDDEQAREVKFQLNFKLSLDVKKSVTERLFSEICSDEESFVKSYYMNEDELKTISEAGMLGSHGYSHVPLTSAADPKMEITHSLDYLENLTQKPVLSFSYPYGSKSAVNENVSRLFGQTNVKFGLTMQRGLNILNEDFDPYLLKRLDTNDAPGGKNWKK